MTGLAALLWSHLKLFWIDELLERETDTLPHVSDVVAVQRHFPVNIDPAGYHVLTHLSTQVFGAGHIGLRLPAVAGFLLMQIFVFLFVRRIAGERGATVALIVPALTYTLAYAAEARPYGFLLSVYALAILLYQSSTREDLRSMATLAGFALTLALAPNIHYFGVLLFVPLGIAELSRVVSRRRIDWGIIAAMGGGLALAVCGILPFRAAAARYREHYYNANALNLHALSEAYHFLLVNVSQGAAAKRVTMAALSALLLVVVVGSVRARRTLRERFPVHELVLLLSLAALPFIAYAVGRYGTHSMEMRYTLGAVIGIAGLCGVALAPALGRDSVYRLSLAVLGVAAVAVIACRLHAEAGKSAAILATLNVSPQLRAQLLAAPDGRVYFEEAGYFQVARFYEPDRELAERMSLLYSFSNEMSVYGRDTNSLTSDHLLHFTNLPIVPYEQVVSARTPHTMVLYKSIWDWSPQALKRDGAVITPLGNAFDGEAVTVRFPGAQQ